MTRDQAIREAERLSRQCPGRDFVVFQDAWDNRFWAMTRENIRFLGDLLGFVENNVTVVFQNGRKVLDRS